MNRRAFLGAIGLAPVAAVAAVAGPTYASGGYVRGSAHGFVGEVGPEAIMPLRRMEGVSVVNTVDVFDPSTVGEYLRTEEGERLIRNVMRRNG